MLPAACFRAFVETVVPSASELDEAAWRELEGIVTEALAARGPKVVRQVRAFLWLVQGLSWVRYGRRFACLDPGRRAFVLARLQSSRLRVVRVGLWGVRTLALMGYWGREEAARSIGWDPDPRGWEALEGSP